MNQEKSKYAVLLSVLALATALVSNWGTIFSKKDPQPATTQQPAPAININNTVQVDSKTAEAIEPRSTSTQPTVVYQQPVAAPASSRPSPPVSTPTTNPAQSVSPATVSPSNSTAEEGRALSRIVRGETFFNGRSLSFELTGPLVRTSERTNFVAISFPFSTNTGSGGMEEMNFIWGGETIKVYSKALNQHGIASISNNFVDVNWKRGGGEAISTRYYLGH